MDKRLALRAVGASLAAGVLTVGAAACSSDDSSNSSSSGGGGTYTVWDPYPQYDATSAWGKLITSCGQTAGVTVKRTGFDTTKLTSQALLAAQQGNAPSVLVVDNPVVSTLVEAGLLADTGTTQQSTSDYETNILGAGVVDGKTYGVPIGANTLALYYNKKVLSAAGVDVSTVKDWDSLTAALAKVSATGKKGITFSAIGTEEGSFQFLPWFWGSGASLTQLDSSEGVSALSLWSDWVKRGYAPKTVINNNQTTSWNEFLTGNFAFAENGTWQLAGVKKSGIDYGIVPIPGRSGGTAAAPTGGEFVTVPAQKDSSKLSTAGKIASCLASPQNALTTDTTLSYVSAIKSVQQQQVSQDPALTDWVTAVGAARGRTADNLGVKYPKISEQLWKAVQGALSGGKSPQAAMSSAQSAAKSATN